MPRKKRTPKKTKKPFKLDMTKLSTNAKLHLIVWDAYTKRGFFAKLVEQRDQAENLAGMLKAYALTSEEMALVRRGLQPDSVLVDPKHVLEGLQAFTKPKYTREQVAKILSTPEGGEIWAAAWAPSRVP